MKTFRVVELTDVTKRDFYDVPFWVHSNGRYVWVGLQHRITDLELHSYVGLYEVHDGVVYPARILASDNNTDHLLHSLRGIYDLGYKVFGRYVDLTPDTTHRRRRGICECETHLGEPCYCGL